LCSTLAAGATTGVAAAVLAAALATRPKVVLVALTMWPWLDWLGARKAAFAARHLLVEPLLAALLALLAIATILLLLTVALLLLALLALLLLTLLLLTSPSLLLLGPLLLHGGLLGPVVALSLEALLWHAVAVASALLTVRIHD